LNNFLNNLLLTNSCALTSWCLYKRCEYITRKKCIGQIYSYNAPNEWHFFTKKIRKIL